MTIIFFVFVFLVIWHFIIEGIIAPSERSKVRLDLFALRDEIRKEKIEYGNEFDDELFEHLQSHANKSIHSLHNYSIVGVCQAYKSRNENDEVLARVDKFFSLLWRSKVPDIYSLHIRSILNTFKGLVINSAGWLI